MSAEIFGHLPMGNAVFAATLATDKLRARIIGYGAALAELQFRHPDGWRHVVLGLPTLEGYLNHSPHLGATAGRYAGRIRDGRVTVDGTVHHLTRNAADGHHVHGGHEGFGKRNWSLAGEDGTGATFEIASPEGDEGYPGALSASCSYRLSGKTLRIEMTATATAPTPVNLLHHSYFNLDGQGTIDGHRLWIDAQARARNGANGLPTGDFAQDRGNAFDFSEPRCLAKDVAYDVSYLLRRASGAEPRPVATLESSRRDLRMVVSTTEPALHLYDGGKLSLPVPGLTGVRYGPRAGLCLEPTRMSDAPNLPSFPNAVLRPGEVYRQVTAFAFDAA